MKACVNMVCSPLQMAYAGGLHLVEKKSSDVPETDQFNGDE